MGKGSSACELHASAAKWTQRGRFEDVKRLVGVKVERELLEELTQQHLRLNRRELLPRTSSVAQRKRKVCKEWPWLGLGKSFRSELVRFFVVATQSLDHKEAANDIGVGRNAKSINVHLIADVSGRARSDWVEP